MTKQVLITGAAGFIGRHVAREYANNDFHVIGVGRGDWPNSQTYGVSEWHGMEVTLDELVKLDYTPDVIVHCAGGSSVGYSVSDPYHDFVKTVGAMAHVLEFMRLHAPEARLVYLSSAAVYGQVKQLPIPESASLIPISPYGIYKLMAEQLCLLYARQYKTSVVIIRLFSIYGVGLHKQLLWDACQKITKRDTRFFGTGNEIRDWLHVYDAARLITIAADHASEECPIVNGGMGIGTTVKEVLAELFKEFGYVEEPIFSGESRVGDPIGYLAEIKLANSWGWQPQLSLINGLREYVAWFKRGAP